MIKHFTGYLRQIVVMLSCVVASFQSVSGRDGKPYQGQSRQNLISFSIEIAGPACKECLKSLVDYFNLTDGIKNTTVTGPLTSSGDGILPGYKLIMVKLYFDPKIISKKEILAKISFIDYQIVKVVHKN